MNVADSRVVLLCSIIMNGSCCTHLDLLNKVPTIRIYPAQESRREGWKDAAIMLCKLNKSL